ncbi:MAG: chromosomal replication initiator protein DnaA [Candidatus Dadabacteria bacterium]|nr:chromosomal replication initiator protein DnaA [Candidatus Dadabacteria bacterium]
MQLELNSTFRRVGRDLFWSIRFRVVLCFSGEELLKKTEEVAHDNLAAENYKSEQKIEFDWDAVLEGVKKDLYIPPSWLFSIKVVKIEGKMVTLEAKTHFQALWVKNHYLQLINDAARNLYGKEGFQVTIDAGEENSVARESKKDRVLDNGGITEPHDPQTASFFSSSNTFDNFVVGPSNQFAHAASYAIAENPGMAYNPLFIHSGVGLGKTHLLHSIGNHILKKYGTRLNTFCISAEHFTNGVVQNIKTGSMDKFRNLYRLNCDVLLIDDIQFIAGKDSTQEEFFHTFNSLYTAKKQIVITSDKPPSVMKNFEERLKSRFEWGLTADIQTPEVETKIAIIERKAEEEQIEIPADVASFVAQNILSNLRELEGSVNKLFAYSKMFRERITLELTKQLLSNLVKKEAPKIITIDLIQKEVGSFFELTVKDLKSNQKQKKISGPRQIAMFLSRKYTSSSFPEIGSRFGGKNHSTVVHAVKNVEKKIGRDPSVSTAVTALSTTLEKFITS